WTPLRVCLAFAALVLAAACTDRGPTELAGPPPAGREVRTEIACTVSVADRAVRCGDPAAAGGGAQDIIMGGQGTYVRLESANAAYDSATDVFSLDVTLQNLLPQAMGTPDGTTATGVRVFFHQLPTATEGTGEIEIANEDGVGSYTGLNQPYFVFPEILQPRGASAPRTWRFGVPGSVARFSFTVYVHTQLPAEEGVLRWRTEDGAAYSAFNSNLYGVWAGGVNDVFVAGTNQIFHWDGNEWSSFLLETQGNGAVIRDLAGSSRRHLYAVGSNADMWRYDGNGWSMLRGSYRFSGSLEGVWARGDTVVTVGWGQGIFGPSPPEDPAGQILVSTDGSSFTRTRVPAPSGTRQLWDVSGSSATDLWAVGFDERPTDTGRTKAVVMHSTDVGATWSERIDEDGGHRYYGAVWAEPGRVIVGGGHINIATNTWEALLMESRDGGATWSETWFAVPGQNRYVREVWGTPGGTLHAVGNNGSTFINTGDGWRDVTGTTPAFLYGLHGAGGEAWAVGTGGAVVRYRGGAWQAVDLKVSTTGTLRSVWGTGAGNVYAVGSRPGPNAAEQSTLLRNDGSGWSAALPAADSTEYADVWGSSASDVYVVGHRLKAGGGTRGMIWRYNGSGWTATAPPFEGTDRRLTAVWGSGAGDVWVMGRQSGASGDEAVILRSTDGGQSWTPAPVGGVPAGEVHVLDAWGSGPGNVYAVGYVVPSAATQSSSMVLRFNGTAWSATVRADSVRLSGVWGAGAGDVHLVGWQPQPPAANQADGITRRSTDGGATWTTQRFRGTSFSNRRLLGVWGTSPSDVYAVGAGPILHFDGTRWQPQGSYGWPTFRAVWGSSAGDVYAVGEKGLIVHGIR
ncbi:MAG TPA: sialidase family protein, partial [Longimicrobium sp.]|nr:sialidase family protein [Longimicrobium sp.]